MINNKLLVGKKFWDKSAESFGRTRSTKFIIYPAFKKLCGRVLGKSVLDIACATGEMAISLAERGANVVGIDFSERMIEIAAIEAKRKKLDNIKFVVDDARILGSVSGRRFDIIIINILLPHLESKKDILKVLKAAASSLEKGGKILLAEPHPCFDFLMRNEIRSRAVVSSYFESGRPYRFEMLLDKGKRLVSIAYHWTLEDYVSLVFQAGLIIKKIYEPKTVKSVALKDPVWYKEKIGCPSYIILEIIKR